MTEITADYQGLLPDADFLFGTGTDIQIARAGEASILGAIGIPDIRSPDVVPTHADGVHGGFDTYAPRILSIPLKVAGIDSESARERLEPFLAAWQTPRNSVVPLDLRLPGTPETVMRYFGRPRAIDETRILWHLDCMWVAAHFVCLDPYAYGDEIEEEAEDTSPLIIVNPGNVLTPQRSRIVLTCTGSGVGSFTITNLDDPDGGTMTFVEGGDYEIDLYGWNVTEDAANRDSQLRADSGWPVLVPGTNRFAFTGFDDLAATWRPAYL